MRQKNNKSIGRKKFCRKNLKWSLQDFRKNCHTSSCAGSSLSLSLFPILSLFLSLSLFLNHSFALNHSHPHTHILSLALSLSQSLFRSKPLSPSQTYSLTRSLSLTHPLFQSPNFLSLSANFPPVHTHTHSLSLT